MSVKALEKVAKKFASEVIDKHSNAGDDTLIVKRAKIKEILKFCRDDKELKFEFCMDVCGMDYLGYPNQDRFEVVYHLYSVTHNHRLRIRARVPENDPVIDTSVDIWPGTNWFEREVWDMYGVKFKGHPDLRRILMYEEFQGHPLRKDYPVNKRQPLIGPQN
ncbi:MAG: NADH-quinone oxidoreductase chain 5 [Myxococcota bacterium]|nr:NADH-quinone oxidoreductase chain 5 [Myxococcota bacterium]